jgi:hypothetical protein
MDDDDRWPQAQGDELFLEIASPYQQDTDRDRARGRSRSPVRRLVHSRSHQCPSPAWAINCCQNARCTAGTMIGMQHAPGTETEPGSRTGAVGEAGAQAGTGAEKQRTGRGHVNVRGVGTGMTEWTGKSLQSMMTNRMPQQKAGPGTALLRRSQRQRAEMQSRARSRAAAGMGQKERRATQGEAAAGSAHLQTVTSQSRCQVGSLSGGTAREAGEGAAGSGRRNKIRRRKGTGVRTTGRAEIGVMKAIANHSTGTEAGNLQATYVSRETAASSQTSSRGIGSAAGVAARAGLGRGDAAGVGAEAGPVRSKSAAAAGAATVRCHNGAVAAGAGAVQNQ